MAFNKNNRALARFISAIALALNLLPFAMNSALADDAITLGCKESRTKTALDFSSLGINLSSAVPVGTVVAEGVISLDFICALDNPVQYYNGAAAEVYIKRAAIADGALGYGLTLYTDIGGSGMTSEAGSYPTGDIITTWAITSGGTVGTYTDVSVSIPFKIVRTSSSMEKSTTIGTVGTISKAFSAGSLVSGSDVFFNITNINNSITIKDETCSVAGDKNQTVTLGEYTASKSSGLGSGIGQTSAMKSFNIQLNCEALLSGKFDVMMQFDGDSASGLSDVGVLALNSTSTARGVGVQILNGSEHPISLATPFSVASYPLSTASVTVPLYARYYQTADTITPGSANAVAQYTISYQ